jgi:hypothetical protein
VVLNQIRALLRAPEVVVRVWWAAQGNGEALDEREVVEALQRLDPCGSAGTASAVSIHPHGRRCTARPTR